MYVEMIEGRCDFDRMVYTTSRGNMSRLTVKDGRVCVVHDDRYTLSTFNTVINELYQEYMSKKIEEELLEDK